MNEQQQKDMDYDAMGNFSRYHTMTPRDARSLENKIRALLKSIIKDQKD
jgi:hypothetical protein